MWMEDQPWGVTQPLFGQHCLGPVDLGMHFQARAGADVKLMHCWAELVCAKLFGFAQLSLNCLEQGNGEAQSASQTAAQWVGVSRSRILATASPGSIWLAVSWSAALFRKGEVGRNCFCRHELQQTWTWCSTQPSGTGILMDQQLSTV